MMDDEIIKKKLLIDGDGIGDDKRISFLMKNLLKWCDQKAGDDGKTVNYEEETLNYERLVALAGQCEHALNKSTLIQEMNQLEMNYYDDLALNIQQTLEQTQIKIEKLKDDLEDAKIVKKNKLVYDEHAEIIFQHPARQQTLKLIEQMNNEIARLNEIKQILEQNFESRKKQFQLMLDELNELECTVNSNQDDLNREIQLLMDDEYYENVKAEKTDSEIVLFKDPSSLVATKCERSDDQSNNHTGELNSTQSNSTNLTDKMDTN